MSDIIPLIEDAEQGGTLQQLTDGAAARKEYDALIRISKIAAQITEVVESSYTVKKAKTCPHGNWAVAPYNQAWFCDDCWQEMQDAIKDYQCLVSG